eukprot:7860416-Pyramimonas_sp.AAC.1
MASSRRNPWWTAPPYWRTTPRSTAPISPRPPPAWSSPTTARAGKATRSLWGKRASGARWTRRAESRCRRFGCPF